MNKVRFFLADNGLIKASDLRENKFDVLVSHAFKDKCIQRLNEGLTIFLDSGAYSAWRRGHKVDIDQYKDFILKWKNQIEFAANLDIIPGSPGSVPSTREIDESADLSLRNYLYLKKNCGSIIVPVYHQHERIEWLERIMRESEFDTLVAISPANDQVKASRDQWLENIWPTISDSSGYPIIKTHAFGVTTPDIIWKYPWYSVDSSTPSQYAKVGSILYIDSENQMKVASVGQRSLDVISQDAVECILSHEFKVPQLYGRQNVKSRMLYNAIVLREYLESKRVTTYNSLQERLF